jgi:hypothetical protein
MRVAFEHLHAAVAGYRRDLHWVQAFLEKSRCGFMAQVVPA